MYAVIKTGGKQYRVIKGETLKIESLDGDIGSAIVFDKVLMLGDGDKVTVGKPLLVGATVAVVLRDFGAIVGLCGVQIQALPATHIDDF